MATYSKSDLVKAINTQCRECNDVRGEWHDGNDCTGKSCALYPYRPGNGQGHAERKVNAVRNTDGLRAARASKTKIPDKAVECIPRQG